MAQPCSNDLRERAMARLAAGEPIRVIAAALRISPSCIPKWSRRVRETGSVSPGQIGGHKPRILSGAVAAWLRARMSEHPFTLRGLVRELAGRGVKADYHSVWDFVHDEGLSFKKNRVRQRAGTRRRGETPASVEGAARTH